MASLQRRVTVGSAITGTILALIVVAADATGLLQQLEWFLYDLRAATCQFSVPPPAPQIVHLDIDDDALDVIARWPWSRHYWAMLLDEIHLANPKVVAIDVLFSEPQPNTIEQRDDQTYVTVEQDPALARSLAQLKCAILPEAFTITAADSSVHKSAVRELAPDLSMGPAELIAKLLEKKIITRDEASAVDQDFVGIRIDAVRDVIRHHLMREKLSVQQLTAKLVPTAPTTSAAASGRIFAPLANVIREEYPHVVSEISLRRFSAPAPPNMRAAPPDAEINQSPLPQFCDAIAGGGFADYKIFSEPIVRAVPLFLQYDGRLHPQFAFAVACKALDADLPAARIESGFVIVPASGGEIRIPVRSRYSPAVNRSVGSIMDIPWFGHSEWLTMYDWPGYRQVVRHYSMTKAWSIIEARQKMSRNNKIIDDALHVLLQKDAAAYAARKLDPDDFPSRRKVAEQTLEDLKADGYEELFRTKPDSELTANELVIKDRMVGVKAAIDQNIRLEGEFIQKRKELAAMLGGKIVYIGATASAMGDLVTTSIHPRCPGVVVHGVITNAVLNFYFLRTAPRWATILLTLFFGLLATAVTSRIPPTRALALLLLIGAAYFAANGLIFFDRLHIIVNAAAPLVAIAVCWSGCMVVRLILEGVERIRLNREAAMIQHEISLARQVQAALIPKELAILRSVESYGWTLAATTTGGDCFDLWKLEDGRLGILVADASGHGLGPSIIVSEVRALVRALCDIYSDPQKLLDRVNARLAADLQGSKFCTAFLGFLSEDGKMSWGSAGHGPMLWCSTRDGTPLELEGTGLPLGVSDEWFGDENVPILDLEIGGWLMAISDGIFEQASPGGEQFGVERVKEIIKHSPSATCEQLVANLRQAVHKWQVVTEPNDDQTIVIVRRLPAVSAEVSFVQSTEQPGESQTDSPAVINQP